MNGREEHEAVATERTEKMLRSYPFYMKEFYDDMEGKSYKTKRNYVVYVLHMFNYIKGKDCLLLGEVATIATDDLEKYMASLEYKILKDGSVKRVGEAIRAIRWTAISYFFRFLKKKGYICEDPFSEYIERPVSEDKVRKHYLSKVQIKQLLKRIEENPEKQYRNRDLAIVTLVLSTGVKESLISEMNVADVDFDRKRILIHDKKENRYIYPADMTMDYLKTWTFDRLVLGLQKESNYSPALFINRNYDRMTPYSLIYMLGTYTNIFKHKVTMETLRCSCIVHMYETTKDVYLTIKATGLKDVRFLERYVKLEDNIEREAGIVMDDFLRYECIECDEIQEDEIETQQDILLDDELVECGLDDDILDFDLGEEELLECEDLLE